MYPCSAKEIKQSQIVQPFPVINDLGFVDGLSRWWQPRVGIDICALEERVNILL